MQSFFIKYIVIAEKERQPAPFSGEAILFRSAQKFLTWLLNIYRRIKIASCLSNDD